MNEINNNNLCQPNSTSPNPNETPLIEKNLINTTQNTVNSCEKNELKDIGSPNKRRMKEINKLIGKTINNKKIIRFVEIFHERSIFEVECLFCGNKYNARKDTLDATDRCGKCSLNKNTGAMNYNWLGSKNIPKTYLNNVREKAKIRNLECSVSLNFLDDLYEKQNKKCYFTGEEISFAQKTASLDRVDSGKGYIEGNVQWVHKDLNSMKWDSKDDDFIKYCINIYQYTHVVKIPNQIPKCPIKKIRQKSFKGSGYISGKTVAVIKKSAKERKIKFNLTAEELNVIFLHQSGKCNLTGEDLFFNIYQHKSKNIYGNASLDRIDSSKGYTKDNVQWITKKTNKIKYTLSANRLIEICKKVTKKFSPNIAISGYFQILHVGHIDYIQSAKKLGGYLIAIINSDEQAKLKSTPAIVCEDHRAKMVEAIRGVDEVIISIDKDESVSKTLEMIKPKYFCNSGDRDGKDPNPKELEVCQRLGIEKVYLKGEKVESSSNLIQKMIDWHNEHKIGNETLFETQMRDFRQELNEQG